MKYNHKRVKAKRVQIDDASSASSDEEDAISKLKNIKRSVKTSEIGKFKFFGSGRCVKPVEFYITVFTMIMITLPTLAFVFFM